MRVLFIHIPKTGGTALRNAMVKKLSKAAHVYDYGPRQPKTSEVVRRLVHEEGRISEFDRYLSENSDCFLYGHVAAARYRELFSDSQIISFLRDPVGRVISEYKHLVRHDACDSHLLDFARRPPEINKQSRMLEGVAIEEMALLGISEYLFTDAAALSRHLGVQIFPRRENVAPKKQLVDIDDGLREEIAALNRRDSELYEKALQLRKERLAEEGPEYLLTAWIKLRSALATMLRRSSRH